MVFLKLFPYRAFMTADAHSAGTYVYGQKGLGNMHFTLSILSFSRNLLF